MYAPQGDARADGCYTSITWDKLQYNYRDILFLLPTGDGDAYCSAPPREWEAAPAVTARQARLIQPGDAAQGWGETCHAWRCPLAACCFASFFCLIHTTIPNLLPAACLFL